MKIISTLLSLLFFGSVLFAAEETVKHVNVAEADKIVAKGNVEILDIRTPLEFSGGHIPGARNIDFNDPLFEQQIKKLDKSKPYLVHCASGGRSTKSLEQFKKLGFKNVIHLDGGFNAWKKEGKKVETPKE